MKLPRDISGNDMVQALTRLGYREARQKGSHKTLKTDVSGGHTIAIPMHDPIKPGTLNSILRDVAEHHQKTREELIQELFG